MPAKAAVAGWLVVCTAFVTGLPAVPPASDDVADDAVCLEHEHALALQALVAIKTCEAGYLALTLTLVRSLVPLLSSLSTTSSCPHSPLSPFQLSWVLKSPLLKRKKSTKQERCRCSCDTSVLPAEARTARRSPSLKREQTRPELWS